MPQDKRPLGLNNPARRAARLNYKAKKAMAKAEKFMSLANNQSSNNSKPATKIDKKFFDVDAYKMGIKEKAKENRSGMIDAKRMSDYNSLINDMKFEFKKK